MDEKVFSRELIGKEVETEKGKHIGILEDLVIDTDSGKIICLLISGQDKKVTARCKTDEAGRAMIETDRMSVQDNKIKIRVNF